MYMNDSNNQNYKIGKFYEIFGPETEEGGQFSI